MTGGNEPAALRRELGTLDAVGIGFGAIVGAGIFVVTGVALARRLWPRSDGPGPGPPAVE